MQILLSRQLISAAFIVKRSVFNLEEGSFGIKNLPPVDST